MTSLGNGHLFQVRGSEQIWLRLKEFKAAAGKKGKGASFVSALRAIHDRLQKDPTHVGDPWYSLKLLKMTVYVIAVHPLVVSYAVHDQKPLVFIKDVSALS